MAKKSGGPSKSQEIRDYYAENPDSKPKQVVEALALKGVVVTPAFVSTIKSTSINKPGRGAKRAAKSVKAAPVRRATTTKAVTKKAAGGELTVDSLMQAKGLADKMGGVDKLMAALDALKQLGQ
ncbi:MAG: hypothetical protein EA381_12485 [Planctomycetaceae bacterium]|nr:MAG: hypothetical protein EA381_12485 [Planctomycetaceae bacterium]